MSEAAAPGAACASTSLQKRGPRFSGQAKASMVIKRQSTKSQLQWGMSAPIEKANSHDVSNVNHTATPIADRLVTANTENNAAQTTAKKALIATGHWESTGS